MLKEDNNLEEKIKRLRKTISHKNMPVEDKQILLKDLEELKQVLVEY